LEQQFFVRPIISKCLLRHERRFVEARQDQLELARIDIDVADGEDRELKFVLLRSTTGRRTVPPERNMITRPGWLSIFRVRQRIAEAPPSVRNQMLWN
jgi:hypothetical protein